MRSLNEILYVLEKNNKKKNNKQTNKKNKKTKKKKKKNNNKKTKQKKKQQQRLPVILSLLNKIENKHFTKILNRLKKLEKCFQKSIFLVLVLSLLKFMSGLSQNYKAINGKLKIT